MRFERKTLNDFLRELGSASPAPGGGAAAAVCAALGASLVEMASRLDARRKSARPAARRKSRAAAQKAARLRTRLLKLSSLDAQAFAEISHHWKKGLKDPALRRALKKGIAVPREIAALSDRAVEAGMDEKKRLSRWLSNDLSEALILLEAAAASALLHARANARLLKGRGRS